MTMLERLRERENSMNLEVPEVPVPKIEIVPDELPIEEVVGAIVNETESAPIEMPVKDVQTDMPVNEILYGNCLDVLKQFPDNHFHAVVTDPPYGLSKQPDMREMLRHWLDGDDYDHGGSGFMGKSWDSMVPSPKIWEEVMRVLKPGGHILSFSGTRTYDLMVTAMRLAGVEIRDKIDYHCDVSGYNSWIYGSGFPKSHNISKAIDKATGTTEEAKLWDGRGTALKPAHEPILKMTKSNDDGTMPDSTDGTPFKYQAKAAKKERNEGCDDLYWCDGETIDKEKYEELIAENEERKDEDGFKAYRLSTGNVFPTVKPLSLMRYLVRLVAPPERGIVLDPFCGSGTTCVAAIIEGHDYIGIDSNLQAIEIANARADHAKREVGND